MIGLANIELPKKVKYTPLKKRAEGAPKADLAGKTYADRLALLEDLRLLTVQMDCVEGLHRNSKCILALHFARLFFQLYILAYCAVFATPFHAPLLQRSMADCHVAMRVALIARGAQAPLLANTAGYALSRCACALTRRLQYG